MAEAPEKPPAPPAKEAKEEAEENENDGIDGEGKHPFFHYYAMLVHQQNMLQDSVRTSTYRDAMIQNSANFKGKVVLDVGTGTGILAFFAAQAGAKKVYAVEASGVADHARTLVERNGYSDRITVLKGKVEDVAIPEKVDVIISEPMGFLLVHERMLESYVAARELHMKPGGLMFPSVGNIYVSCFTDQALWDEQMVKVNFWQQQDFYGVDLSYLYSEALKHHLAQPVVGYFDPKILLTPTPVMHRINFGTASKEDLKTITIPFSFPIHTTALLHGLACWFDVSFDGKTAQVVLSTAPSAAGTHWYQCRLLLKSPVAVNAGQVVSGKLHMVANKSHSYDVTIDMKLDGTHVQSSANIGLQDQMYHYLTQPAGGYQQQQQGYQDQSAWAGYTQ